MFDCLRCLRAVRVGKGKNGTCVSFLKKQPAKNRFEVAIQMLPKSTTVWSWRKTIELFVGETLNSIAVKIRTRFTTFTLRAKLIIIEVTLKV